MIGDRPDRRRGKRPAIVKPPDNIPASWVVFLARNSVANLGHRRRSLTPTRPDPLSTCGSVHHPQAQTDRRPRSILKDAPMFEANPYLGTTCRTPRPTGAEPAYRYQTCRLLARDQRLWDAAEHARSVRVTGRDYHPDLVTRIRLEYLATAFGTVAEWNQSPIRSLPTPWASKSSSDDRRTRSYRQSRKGNQHDASARK